MDVFDTDSDYANHPPPTDSEAEYEPLPVYVSSSTSLATMSNRSGRPPSNMLHSRNDSRETLLENEDLVNQVILFGISSTATTDLNRQRNSLKELGLKRLSPREHIAVAICRDFSLLVIIKNLAVLWHSWYTMMYDEPFQINVTSVRASEFFLAGIWCMVSGFLSYSILDGLMVRWIVMYAIQAAIVRMLSMSLLIVALVEVLTFMFNNKQNEYCLPVWILISCVMTLIYIIQNFVTSNLRLDSHLQDKDEPKPQNKVPRTVDLYNITVFAVVPIGLASFVTMIGLIRLVLILRLEAVMEKDL
ncbi:hypothetical protein KL921_001179 [Ogataea angusta]|uniref:N-glycosylation protein EOS1 n=1 Tax=Pichia angusta TaxID=870730 RepID=A0ABQ7S3A0_PICAN|nr:hypothetical protein KL921_001179 [Ogataea angusta]KAG7832216.1 hypothetical protein KL920_000551 [Ogataea angusta]KAG7836388.1 hypothetical protein KL943_002037 [Ogataea angusta]KAG7843455.1 hypothetical protein KL942_000551 [Ogataea angusta]KAG7851672.1 hypothetical protein KL941_001341 [Ogataea angusta]